MSKIQELSFDMVKNLQEQSKLNTKSTKSVNPPMLQPVVLHSNVLNETSNHVSLSMNQNDLHLNIPEILSNRMFVHQKEALTWLSNMHTSHPGGVLGDDMGMGKTFTIICFLCGLFRSSSINSVLILCPVSVLETWMRELSTHLLPHNKVCYWYCIILIFSVFIVFICINVLLICILALLPLLIVLNIIIFYSYHLSFNQYH